MAACKLKRAQILPAADAGMRDAVNAASVTVGGSTDQATLRRRQSRAGAKRITAPSLGAYALRQGDGAADRHRLLYTNPPERRARWTLELLAEEMVMLTEH